MIFLRGWWAHYLGFWACWHEGVNRHGGDRHVRLPGFVVGIVDSQATRLFTPDRAVAITDCPSAPGGETGIIRAGYAAEAVGLVGIYRNNSRMGERTQMTLFRLLARHIASALCFVTSARLLRY